MLSVYGVLKPTFAMIVTASSAIHVISSVDTSDGFDHWLLTQHVFLFVKLSRIKCESLTVNGESPIRHDLLEKLPGRVGEKLSASGIDADGWLTDTKELILREEATVRKKSCFNDSIKIQKHGKD